MYVGVAGGRRRGDGVTGLQKAFLWKSAAYLVHKGHEVSDVAHRKYVEQDPDAAQSPERGIIVRIRNSTLCTNPFTEFTNCEKIVLKTSGETDRAGTDPNTSKKEKAPTHGTGP